MRIMFLPDGLQEYWHKHTNQLLLVLFQVRFKKCAPINIPVILGTLLIALLHCQHQLKQCALVHVECMEYEVDPLTQHSCYPWCSACLVTPAPTHTPHCYPQGMLDLLANRCLAQGTNAWTDVDHTCYTVTTAGSEGFLNLLPIYLDHVLYPTLTVRW